MNETLPLGEVTKRGFEWNDGVILSRNGVDFEIVGFIEKPCITHYKEVRKSKICRECSPGRLWIDRGVGHEMACSHWVGLEEWTGQWMETL